MRSGRRLARSALYSLLLTPFASATQVETFSDPNCQTPLTDWNGPNGYPDGLCTSVSRNGNWTSFRILNLNPGCAITLYGSGTRDGPCDPKAPPGALVADAGTCFNTTWSFYSIDGCFKTNTQTDEQTSTTSTNNPSTSATSAISSASASTSPAHIHHSHTNVGAIVGGVIGGVAFGCIIAAVAFLFWNRRRKRRQASPPDYPDAPGSSHGLAHIVAKEMPGGSLDHDSRAGSMRSGPGTLNEPQELSTEGIAEAPNSYLVELPDREVGMKGFGGGKM